MKFNSRMKKKPCTIAHIKIYSQNFATQSIQGEVSAGGFNWQFNWQFNIGRLDIEPPLGRALITDSLLRFLIKSDYYLEPGGDYTLEIKAKL